jgi:hypothetical protein
LTSSSQGAHSKSCANCLDLIQVEWISYSLLTVLLQILALEVFIDYKDQSKLKREEFIGSENDWT